MSASATTGPRSTNAWPSSAITSRRKPSRTYPLPSPLSLYFHLPLRSGSPVPNLLDSQHFTKFILKDFKKRRETEGASPAPPPKKATPRKRNPRKRPAPVEDDSEESDEVEAKTEKKEKKEKKPKLEGSVKSEEEGDSHHTRERR